MLNQTIIKLLPENLQKRVAVIVVSSIIKIENKINIDMNTFRNHIKNDSDITLGFGVDYRKEVDKFVTTEHKLLALNTIQQYSKINKSPYSTNTDWESVDADVVINEAADALKAMQAVLNPEAQVHNLSENQKYKASAVSELIAELHEEIEFHMLTLYNKVAKK